MDSQNLQYLKQDEIGKVIAKGLASLYTQKPNAPIKYLAHWLKNYSSNQKQLTRLTAEANNKATNLTIYNSNIELDEQRKRDEAVQRQKEQERIKKFRDQIANHEYQQELLQEELPEFIEKLYSLTGAYVGELNHPRKEISPEDTEENAHLDLNTPKLINYIGSSQSHAALMRGKTLPLEKGVTAKAFELSLDDQPQEVGEDGNPIPQEKKDKCIYIPNVVKNENVHYFRLPKLGAYLAVPLIYNCYLKESIFDAALTAKRKENQDREQFTINKNQALEEIEKQKQQLAKQIAELKEKSAEESQTTPLEEELQQVDEKLKAKQAEEFEVGSVELPIEKREYVFCVDNLGSDQEIACEHRQFVVEFIKHFRDSWSSKELELLNKDVETQIEYEKKYLDGTPVEELISGIDAELELDEEAKEQMEAIEDEGMKNYKIEVWKIDRLKNHFLNNEKYIESFDVIRHFRVVKFRELIQNLLYFQGRTKEEVNLRGQAGIDWKNVKKNLINKDLFKDILAYVIEGPKEGEYAPYAKINSIIAKLEAIPDAEVFDYNIGLGALKKYVLRALNHRLSNIELRKVQREEEKRKIEEILIENEKIAEDKKQALETHKATLPAEEVQSFSQEAWSAKYDQEHPLHPVPEGVVDDKDNDL